jgi:hypothetical protein
MPSKTKPTHYTYTKRYDSSSMPGGKIFKRYLSIGYV